VCRQGFEDAYRYLSRRGIIQCADCRALKLEEGLTCPADWRRVPSTSGAPLPTDNSCEGCDQLFLDASHRCLPADLCAVFAAAADIVNEQRCGVLGRLSSLSLVPCTLSARQGVADPHLVPKARVHKQKGLTYLR
jgi:hypothetical protein